jgi:hypothetical protein
MVVGWSQHNTVYSMHYSIIVILYNIIHYYCMIVLNRKRLLLYLFDLFDSFDSFDSINKLHDMTSFFLNSKLQ